VSNLGLQKRRADSVTLVDALRVCAGHLNSGLEPGGRAVIMLYGPGRSECVFAVLAEDGSLDQHGQATVDLRRVFEARAFSDRGELRWLRRPSGLGRADLVSEHDASEFELDWKVSVQGAHRRLDNAYLLWGTRQDGAGDGWTRHFDPRTGSLWIPYEPTGKGERAWIHSREYLVECDHGNLAMAEELLVGVSDLEPEKVTT
jgi:CRISPR-associated protein (TIGR03984 family)